MRSTADARAAPEGHMAWYLVAAAEGCGPGSGDSDSSGDEVEAGITAGGRPDGLRTAGAPGGERAATADPDAEAQAQHGVDGGVSGAHGAETGAPEGDMAVAEQEDGDGQAARSAVVADGAERVVAEAGYSHAAGGRPKRYFADPVLPIYVSACSSPWIPSLCAGPTRASTCPPSWPKSLPQESRRRPRS